MELAQLFPLKVYSITLSSVKVYLSDLPWTYIHTSKIYKYNTAITIWRSSGYYNSETLSVDFYETSQITSRFEIWKRKKKKIVIKQVYKYNVLEDNLVSQKLYDHMCNNTLACIHNAISQHHVNNAFSYCNNAHFEGDKIPFKEPYDKQNLTLMAISYKIYDSPKVQSINFI